MAASYASFNKEKERIQNCWWIGWRVVRKGRNRRWLWGYKPPRERWWVWVTFSLSYRSGPQHRLRTETLKDESLLLQNMPFLSRWWIYCGVTPWLRRAARPTPFEEVAVILGLTWQNGCYRNTICNSWSARTSASPRAMSSATAARWAGLCHRARVVRSILPFQDMDKLRLSALHYQLCLAVVIHLLSTCPK